MQKESKGSFRRIRNNKIDVMFVVFLLISVSVVWAVTRTITDSSDTVDTYIRNSNGNYWEATGANLQLAIDDLTTGGTIWLPEGTIEISSAIKPINNTKIIGSNSTIRLADAGNDMMINIGYDSSSPNANQGKHNITIEGINFDGNYDSQTWNQYYVGIAICSDSSNITIRDCSFNNTCADMIWIYRLDGNTISPENIVVENNRFDTIERHVGDFPGAVYVGGRYCTVKDNYIKDTWACGVILEDWHYYDSCYNVVDGNIITGNISHGIHCEAEKSHSNIISNNIIKDINSSAYWASASEYSVGMKVTDNTTVSGNIIDGVCDDQIRLTGNNITIIGNKLNNSFDDGADGIIYNSVNERDIFIKNNEIKNVRYGVVTRNYWYVDNNFIEKVTRGVVVGEQNNVSITNNNIVDTSGTAIHLYNSKNCVVTNNVCRGETGILANGNGDYNIITNNNVLYSTTGVTVAGNENSIINNNMGYKPEKTNHHTLEYDSSYYFNLTAQFAPTTFIIPCFGVPPTAVNGQMYLDTGNYSLAIYYDGNWHWHEEI